MANNADSWTVLNTNSCEKVEVKSKVKKKKFLPFSMFVWAACSAVGIWSSIKFVPVVLQVLLAVAFCFVAFMAFAYLISPWVEN